MTDSSGNRIDPRNWLLKPEKNFNRKYKGMSRNEKIQASLSEWEISRSEKTPDTDKHWNLILRTKMLREGWIVKRKELKEDVPGRLKEFLNHLNMVSIDSEGKGQVWQLSGWSSEGVTSFAFRGGWFPDEINDLLERYKPVICADNHHDIEVLIKNLEEYIIMDPSLIAMDLSRFGLGGRCWV